MSYADLNTANLRGSDRCGVNLSDAVLNDADLAGADLSDAKLAGAQLDRADLENVNCQGLKWRGLHSMRSVNLFGAKNLPQGFAEWPRNQGAVFIKDDPR